MKPRQGRCEALCGMFPEREHPCASRNKRAEKGDCEPSWEGGFEGKNQVRKVYEIKQGAPCGHIEPAVRVVSRGRGIFSTAGGFRTWHKLRYTWEAETPGSQEVLPMVKMMHRKKGGFNGKKR